MKPATESAALAPAERLPQASGPQMTALEHVEAAVASNQLTNLSGDGLTIVSRDDLAAVCAELRSAREEIEALANGGAVHTCAGDTCTRAGTGCLAEVKASTLARCVCFALLRVKGVAALPTGFTGPEHHRPHLDGSRARQPVAHLFSNPPKNTMKTKNPFGVWLPKARLRKTDGLVIGGSWRTWPANLPGEWTMSSEYDARRWADCVDSDRTHFLRLPPPPPTP